MGDHGGQGPPPQQQAPLPVEYHYGVPSPQAAGWHELPHRPQYATRPNGGPAYPYSYAAYAPPLAPHTYSPYMQPSPQQLWLQQPQVEPKVDGSALTPMPPTVYAAPQGTAAAAAPSPPPAAHQSARSPVAPPSHADSPAEPAEAPVPKNGPRKRRTADKSGELKWQAVIPRGAHTTDGAPPQPEPQANYAPAPSAPPPTVMQTPIGLVPTPRQSSAQSMMLQMPAVAPPPQVQLAPEAAMGGAMPTYIRTPSGYVYPAAPSAYVRPTLENAWHQWQLLLMQLDPETQQRLAIAIVRDLAARNLLRT